MFSVENVGEFNLFFPSEDIVHDCYEKLKYGRSQNEAFLASFVADEKLPVKITGSYIHAHGPDYYGTPTLNYTVADWEKLFKDMLSRGIDTAVFQASLWHELSECYYPSEYFKSEYRQWNIIEPMLEAAQNCTMKIILGAYGSAIGWLSAPDEKAVRKEIDRQLHCIKELFKYKDKFDGIYFSPETAFHGERNAHKEKMLNTIYREYFSVLKELAPEKPIAISPGSLFCQSMQEHFLDYWMALLENVPLDILMPQDSIGTWGCSLVNQKTMWQFWRKVADAKGITLWSHTEIFERQHFRGKGDFTAASPERVIAQLHNLAPFVEKCICFEYPYFANNAPKAQVLKEKIFPIMSQTKQK